MLQKLEEDYAPCDSIPELGANKKDQIVANILKGLRAVDSQVDGITTDHLQKQADAAYNRSSSPTPSDSFPAYFTSQALVSAY